MSEQLLLHTMQPEQRRPDQAPPYRNIVGIGEVVLPGLDGQVDTERLLTSSQLAQGIRRCFERYMRTERTYRNCHLGAAAITGVECDTWINALDIAGEQILDGEVTEQLPEGAHGVIGFIIDGEELALHSLVGLNPQEGTAVQIDSENGPMSIADVDATVKAYKKEHGTGVRLFAQRS